VTVAALLSDVSIAVKIKKYFLTADFLPALTDGSLVVKDEHL